MLHRTNAGTRGSVGAPSQSQGLLKEVRLICITPPRHRPVTMLLNRTQAREGMVSREEWADHLLQWVRDQHQ